MAEGQFVSDVQDLPSYLALLSPFYQLTATPSQPSADMIRPRVHAFFRDSAYLQTVLSEQVSHHNERGNDYAADGHFEEAIVEFRQAV